MVAKLTIRVCPCPGCVTISSRDGVCPAHPHKNLVHEVYEHCPKAGSRPGDLGGAKKNPSTSVTWGDLLDGIFGSDRPGGKS